MNHLIFEIGAVHGRCLFLRGLRATSRPSRGAFAEL